MGTYYSKKRVAQPMKQADLKGTLRRRRQGTTRQRECTALQPDLVNRNVTAQGPHPLWVPDMTQHPTNERWLCLAVVTDAL